MRWFLLGVLEFELFLGLGLLGAILPRHLRVVALGTFVVFSLVSLIKGLAGEASCGCLGMVEISPWYMLVFDLAVLAAMLRWRPEPVGQADLINDFRPRKLAVTAAVGLFIGVSGAVLVAKSTPASLTIDGDIVGDSSLVTLDPGSWVGQRFPLLPHIDTGAALSKGQWIVVLHRHNCPPCQEAIPQYMQAAYEFSDSSSVPRIALVEVPPFLTSSSSAKSTKSVCLHGRLSEARTWRVATPTFIRLQDAATTQVTEQPGLFLREFSPADMNSDAAGFGGVAGPLRGFPDYERAKRIRLQREVACGPLALIAILRSSGIPLTPEEIEALIAEAGTRGTDLLQLKKLAEEKGLHALGASLTVENLVRLALPAVVHLDESMFAAVTGYTDDGVQLVHPWRGRLIVPLAQFEKSFGIPGRALLLSRRPLSPERLGLAMPPAPLANDAGPRLRLDKGLIAVGRIHRRTWRATLDIHNDGRSDLQIFGIKAIRSCADGELTATADAPVLSPGTKTVLRLQGKDEQGTFLHHILLQTNQRDEQEVKIPVRGYVEQAIILDRPALIIERVPTGQPASAEVDLVLAEGINPADIRVDVPGGVPLDTKIHRTENGRTRLHLNWRGAAEPAWRRYRLEVQPGKEADWIATPLLLAVQVEPDINVFPPTVLIRDDEASVSWTRHVKVRGPGLSDKGCSLTWSESRFAKATRVDLASDKDGELRITLAPTNMEVTKPLLGQLAGLTVRCSNGVEVTIPVHFGVTSFAKKEVSGMPPEKK